MALSTSNGMEKKSICFKICGQVPSTFLSTPEFFEIFCSFRFRGMAPAKWPFPVFFEKMPFFNLKMRKIEAVQEETTGYFFLENPLNFPKKLLTWPYLPIFGPFLPFKGQKGPKKGRHPFFLNLIFLVKKRNAYPSRFFSFSNYKSMQF